MSHSYLKNKVSLQTFTPPRGTTKVVELTLAERKRIALKHLGAYVAGEFSREPTRVTIRSFGYYTTIANVCWGFQVTPVNRRSPEQHTGFKTLKEFAEYLGSGVFHPTELLRMSKLIRKRESIKRSVDGMARKRRDEAAAISAAKSVNFDSLF